MGEVVRGITTLMTPVEGAHWANHILRPDDAFSGLAHFRADLHAQRVGYAQFLVIATGIDRGQHREQRLAGFQSNLGTILRPARCPDQHHCQAESERRSNS